MRYLILHNIRSAQNVGSMFRTADAFGVEKIFLTGYTPAPIDRFGRVDNKVTKAALGAEKSVGWQQTTVEECIANLKSKGVRVIALEQDKRAVPLAEYRVPQDWALIAGNEVEGLESEVLALADDILEIPMQGMKESLNVSVAAGIALFSLTK